MKARCGYLTWHGSENKKLVLPTAVEPIRVITFRNILRPSLASTSPSFLSA